jgi:hypothetical protein
VGLGAPSVANDGDSPGFGSCRNGICRPGLTGIFASFHDARGIGFSTNAPTVQTKFITRGIFARFAT